VRRYHRMPITVHVGRRGRLSGVHCRGKHEARSVGTVHQRPSGDFAIATLDLMAILSFVKRDRDWQIETVDRNVAV
jgi:hypothetical protein